ncbi:antitoxin [Comamonadaceae bacterium]|nr:antitoxin [Comamonadaceae bacterium]
MRTISASDANRHFSALLRDVATGEIITVLSRGKPVATIASARSSDGERAAAKLNLLGRLRQQNPSGARNWTRDELYGD